MMLFAALLALQLNAATTESVNDEAIERAAETLIQENQAPAKVARSEEDTPVVLSEPSAPKSGGSIAWRLLASLVVLGIAGVGLAYASRRWSRRSDVGGAQTRIELLHQFHLGPRKSLALVRVAGESLLLGVTDQNVNMLKSITIIDADMEAALSQDFNNFLDDEFSVADVNSVVGQRA